jgi:hypothetical protein
MVLQAYLTNLILTYARKYIRNIQANLNISLWGGDVVLNNLDLRLDGQRRMRHEERPEGEEGTPRARRASRRLTLAYASALASLDSYCSAATRARCAA